MENKLLEQNISRVLSNVGKDGRTVTCVGDVCWLHVLRVAVVWAVG